MIGASVSVYGGPDPTTGSFTIAGVGQVSAAAGNNTIAGGSGTDVIMLGDGNNQVFADSVESISTALTHNGGPANGSKGDLIAVGNGSNTIVAGEGNDHIFLGYGNNVVIGGSGKQVILGGLVDTRGFLDWYDTPATLNGIVVDEYIDTTFTGSTAAAPAGYEGSEWFTRTGDFVPVGGGNDTIFGGTGGNWGCPNAGICLARQRAENTGSLSRYLVDSFTRYLNKTFLNGKALVKFNAIQSLHGRKSEPCSAHNRTYCPGGFPEEQPRADWLRVA